MKDAILVVNAGSASLKYALYAENLVCLLRHHVETRDPSGALREVLARVRREYRITGAGHRVVYGGDRYAAPMQVNAKTLTELDELGQLAPLHQLANTAGLRVVAALAPGLPQVACFDTAFHQRQPKLARGSGLRPGLRQSGVEHCGLHGLSYEYVATRLPQAIGRHACGRVIVAHLGNGASLCALRDGRSVATSIGFTALQGLMMDTRCSTPDPDALVYLMDKKRMSGRDLERLLDRESGLLGLSGLSNDMRTLLASVDPRAKLAVELFVHRTVREIGSLATVLQGLDALVFTGGIGENATAVRTAISAAVRWLGTFQVSMVATNEEEMIARHTFAVLTKSRCAMTA